MHAVVERAEPDVNAFAEQRFEQALRLAAVAEKQHAPGGQPRPLEGLPIAAKEEQPLAGYSITEGTLLRPPRVAQETAIGLSRIQAAGGILHARTGV